MMKVRKAHVPVRREELLLLAEHNRAIYKGLSLEAIAEVAGFIFIREAGGPSAPGGFAYSRIESMADGSKRQFDAMVINPEHVNEAGELVDERQTFWHEYYHLWYSPSRVDSPSDPMFYSTRGALHAQEERRANEFAAAMLIDSVEPGQTPQMIAERYQVTTDLAALGIKLLRNQGNSTRQ